MMKSKCKSTPKLWFCFSLVVLAVISIPAFIIIFVTILVVRSGNFNLHMGIPIAPILFLCLVSVVIGVCISLVVTKLILKPLTTFTQAVSEVSKGNFDIRLQENYSIAELADLTKNFNKMVQELAGTDMLRNDFIANVSHEFKTPIASIEGYAMLLQDRDLTTKEKDDYSKMILESSKQLSNLTGNILILSKVENQELILEKKPYRLDEQLRQIVLMFENEWSSKELDLQIDLPTTYYNGNKKIMLHVWANIIGNAIKFTQKNGTVKINLQEHQNEVVVSVCDTGCGIDEKSLEHIFDKFYQADYARQSKGNGLGLALVKRIVDLCNGHIDVTSTVNKGTSFYVTLPHAN